MDQLIIISNFTFKTQQGAAYSRLLCYAKALKGALTVYITSKDCCDRYIYTKTQEVLDNFFILSTASYRQRNKMYWLLFRHFDFIGACKYLKNINKVFSKELTNNNIYLFYGSELALTIVAFFYLKLLKKKQVFIEKSELEIGIILNQSIQLNTKGLFLSFLFPFQLLCSFFIDLLAPLFSGIIVISKKLERLYSRSFTRILYLPIINSLVEEKLISTEFDNGHFLIGYTGTISKKKDGLFECVKALGTLPQVYKDVILFNIYGEGNIGEVNELKEEIASKHLDSIIIINKMVHSYEIPAILSKQNLLVLTRSSNIQTEYGFSTKLAEYLMAGVPVLATKVSDNSLFLKDEENALLVEPGNIDAIASKIQFAVDNRAIIRNIGIEGRKTAELNFYYGLYSEKLREFLLA